MGVVRAATTATIDMTNKMNAPLTPLGKIAETDCVMGLDRSILANVTR